MTSSRKFLQHPAFILFGCIALTLFLLVSFLPKTVNVTRVVVGSDSTSTRSVWLPHWSRGFSRPVEYRLHVRYASHQNGFYQFVPTGCIERITVNKVNIPFPKKRACNGARGFKRNLTRYLNPGENDIVVRLAANSNYGVDVYPNMLGGGLLSATGLLLVALMVEVLVGFTLLLRHLGAKKFTQSVFVAAGLMMFWQMYQTTYMEYVTDMPSHVQYTRFITAHWLIPAPDRGWQYYHPPLYYALSAIPFSFAKATQAINPIAAMRFFTLLLFLGTLFFGVLSMRCLFKKDTLAYRSALCLLCFWPAGIMLCARPESNLLYYFFFSAAIYTVIKWLETKEARYMLWLFIAAGLAVGTRSNGLVVMGIAGSLFCWALYHRQLILTSKQRGLIYAAVLSIAFGFGINYGRIFYYAESRDMEMDYIVGNIESLTRNVTIEQNALNFFKFSPSIYFNYPYLNNGNEDAAGRQYFWNFFLKSSLYGQFDLWVTPQLAMGLSAMLLVLIAYMLAGCILALRKRTDDMRNILGIGLIIAMALAAMGLHRYSYPFAPSQDFRYVYPLVICFAALFGISARTLQHYVWKHSTRLGCVLVAVFTALTLSFFISQRNHFLIF